MTFLERIQTTAKDHPDTWACVFAGKSCTYRQLWETALCIGANLAKYPDNLIGVEVGKPNWQTLAAFLGCLLAGKGYLPLDRDWPVQRLEKVCATAGVTLLLCPGEYRSFPAPLGRQILWEEMALWLTQPAEGYSPTFLMDERPAYCLFTSGSSGTPKGVRVSRRNLAAFLEWAAPYTGANLTRPKYLGAAPLTFDLSVLPCYGALAQGGCVYHLDTGLPPADLLHALQMTKAQVWVSTPSFAEYCLALPEFTEELLPELHRFFFCGEELRPATVERLSRRFPGREVINSYGPTEATVAVTAVKISPQMLSGGGPLPVGAPMPGTGLYLTSAGEVILLGDTVALGYCDPQQTRQAFFRHGEQWAYRTGDRGRLIDGLLWWEGRLDLQIKHRGYRIDPLEIERQLLSITGVTEAAVVQRTEPVPQLWAFYCGDSPLPRAALREALREHLPDYLLPTHWRQLDAMPLTANGKLDRTKLKEGI